MIGIESLLNNLRYKELAEIAKEEKLQTKGKKNELIQRLAENLDANRLREYYAEYRGATFDLFMHGLVPNHEVLAKEEAETLLGQFNIDLRQLPKILQKDPAVVSLNAKPGDIIRIKRVSQTAGEAFYYRIVVAALGRE